MHFIVILSSTAIFVRCHLCFQFPFSIQRCFSVVLLILDRLCGLVVRVCGYISRGPEFDSRPYQIFWEVHSASWGQLRRYLNEKVAAPVYTTEINGRGNSLLWPRNTLNAPKLALTSPTSGGRSVGIVHLRTKATEFFYCLVLLSFAT
jgi:hypothetical protein